MFSTVALLLAIPCLGYGDVIRPEPAGICSVRLDELLVKKWQEMKGVEPGEVGISANAPEIARRVTARGQETGLRCERLKRMVFPGTPLGEFPGRKK